MKRIFGHSFHCHDLPEKTARSRLQAAVVCSRPSPGEESRQDKNTPDCTQRPFAPINLFNSTDPFPSLIRSKLGIMFISNRVLGYKL